MAALTSMPLERLFELHNVAEVMSTDRSIPSGVRYELARLTGALRCYLLAASECIRDGVPLTVDGVPALAEHILAKPELAL